MTFFTQKDECICVNLLSPAHYSYSPCPFLCVWVCLCVHTQLCLTLYDPMDCSPPGSSVHGIFQARKLEWVAISSSRRSSQSRDWTCVSFISHADGDSLPLAPPGKTVQSFKKLKVEMEFSVAETWGQRLKYFTCFRGVMWTLLYQDTLCQQQKALWGEQVGQGWGTVLWCLPASWTVRWIPDSSPCYFQDLHHCVETPPWLMTRLPPDSSRKPPPGLCGLQLSKLYGGRADGQGF